MATILPPSIPMSVTCLSAPNRRAFFRMRSMLVPFETVKSLRLRHWFAVSEIRPHQRRIFLHLRSDAGMLDLPGLENIGAIRDRKGKRGNLVNKQDRSPLVAQIGNHVV